jgi:choice-of-anchor B domain-containing protein
MDDFGRSLALEGNTLLVGAPRKQEGSGVVYHFERSGPGEDWAFAGTVAPPSPGPRPEYGSALALQGDELLVGAPSADGGGAVHRFRRDGPGWVHVRSIRATDGDDVAGFGAALSWEGSRLLVGAPASDGGRGQAYLLRTPREGGWGEPVPIALPDEVRGERGGGGSSVLLVGDQGFVGAPGSDVVAVVEPDPSGAGWSVVSTLTAFDDPPRSGFGFSLAGDGGEVWVGAPGADGANGRVYRFVLGDAGSWRDGGRVDPDVTDGSSWPLGFGYALALAEDRAVVGMPSRDFGEGRAMALSRSGAEWRQDELLEGRIYRIGSGLTPGDRCDEGAMTEFPCDNMQLVAHVPISELGGERGVWLNDVWGWTDPATGRRYALVARRDGASFVDVTDAAAPRLVGNLPRTEGSRPSVWRDIKVIGTTAYIVADGAGQHGMQVFDLTRLRSVGDAPAVFEPDWTYRKIASAHNVVADTLSRHLYIVAANSGGTTCGGGLHIVDATEALEPTFAGCYHDPGSAGARGYTHDAQCVVYHGPDPDYQGREICLGSNETELNIADVTDKESPVSVARASYPNVAYAHQGWFDDEQRFFYMNDEGDEVAGTVSGTRTLVWDLTDLDDPVLANEYIGPVRASDHNLYVVGDRMYQSNYGSGLRVLDISDRENPREVAFFDSAPYNDDEPGFSAAQSGAWSNYPFFEDGLVVFTSVREGLFIMRVSPRPVS